jgi:hypothetical protein
LDFRFEDCGDGIEKVIWKNGKIKYRLAGQSAEEWMTKAEARRNQFTPSSRPTKNKG